MKNFKESCKFPHSFFQNYSRSSPLEIDSLSNSGDTADGVPGDTQKDPHSNSSHGQGDPKENDSSDIY